MSCNRFSVFVIGREYRRYENRSPSCKSAASESAGKFLGIQRSVLIPIECMKDLRARSLRFLDVDDAIAVGIQSFREDVIGKSRWDRQQWRSRATTKRRPAPRFMATSFEAVKAELVAVRVVAANGPNGGRSSPFGAAAAFAYLDHLVPSFSAFSCPFSSA